MPKYIIDIDHMLARKFVKEGHMKILKERKKDKDGNPCWDGYEMVGMKTKGKKEVPNCVPKTESHKRKTNEHFYFIDNETQNELPKVDWMFDSTTGDYNCSIDGQECCVRKKGMHGFCGYVNGKLCCKGCATPEEACKKCEMMCSGTGYGV